MPLASLPKKLGWNSTSRHADAETLVTLSLHIEPQPPNLKLKPERDFFGHLASKRKTMPSGMLFPGSALGLDSLRNLNPKP